MNPTNLSKEEKATIFVWMAEKVPTCEISTRTGNYTCTKLLKLMIDKPCSHVDTCINPRF